MNILLDILNWFSQNILQKPAFFVGLLVLIGYLLLYSRNHCTMSLQALSRRQSAI